ncbi:MAG: hypothetical protein K2X87_25790 [Gemmataceae bacterium]|nr:hypothetical protein [Gemmataceae bacterium]
MEAEDDDIVARVRAAREAIAARFNYDLDAIFAHLRERERQSGRVVLPPPPKPAAVEAEPDPVAGEVPPPAAKAG